MDLLTAKKKLADDLYESSLEFKSDIELIFKNSLIFNPINTQVFRDAARLVNYFEGKFKEYFPPPLSESKTPRAILGNLEYRKVERTFVHLESLTCINEFRYRVNPTTVPGYYLKIEKPIDFGTIKAKWASMEYCNMEEVEADMLLMFQNCYTYNSSPELAIHQQCLVLEREFKSKWREPLVAPVVEYVAPVVKRVAPMAPVVQHVAPTAPVVEHVESVTRHVSPVAPVEKLEMYNHFSADDVDQCALLLDRLVAHTSSLVFRMPVDPIALNIPQYAEIVKNPMDFSTIKSKLQEYGNIEAFLDDVRLIFSNCYLFNPPGL
jgi:hypothetical protein